jgi:hypothetical protein
MTGRRRQDSDEGSWLSVEQRCSPSNSAALRRTALLSVEDGWRPWGSVYGLVVESRRERFATKP